MCHTERLRRTGFTLVEMLVVIAIIGVLAALLIPAIQAARESARRTTCQNNLKQIAFAVQQYHSQYHVFPPGSLGGRTQHSWVPALLTYMEEGSVASLYDWKVSWNDPSNQEAITTPLDLLGCPSTPEDEDRLDQIAPGLKAAISDYAPVGSIDPTVAAGLTPPPRSLGGVMPTLDLTATPRPKWIRVEDIRDGLSSTIVIIEDAARPVFRTADGTGPANNDPDGGGTELPVVGGRVQGAGWADPNSIATFHSSSADGLTAPGPCTINCTNNNEAFAFHPGGIHCFFADNSVHFLAEEISVKVYAALVTRNGGEVISQDDF